MGYDITHTKFYDTFGRFLWSDPLKEEFRLYQIGETFRIGDDLCQYKVLRVAVVENTQVVNVSVIEEDANILEPHL